MSFIPEHFQSIFFIIGLLTVAAFAWRKFNEPSFPDRDTLPQAVEPLRYLFLRSGYHKARVTYVVASLLLYCVFVWPGPKLQPYFGIVGAEKFPAEGWALVIAIVLVGLLPNSNIKPLVVLEETVRRGIHAYFLVPNAAERTIGILEDVRYKPPAEQLGAVPSPLREELQRDLALDPTSLRYRWARARMLMESLKQMGNGAPHPLKRAAFEPFRDDFKRIRDMRNTLAQEIASAGDVPAADKEDALGTSVNELLKRIYAYISWGLRYEADSERAVDDTLRQLGFRVPVISGHRLFDIVAPMVFCVALINMVFWILVDAALGMELSDNVVSALTSACAAGLMYGFAVYIALNRRTVQIERKTWRQDSARCLVSIAIVAGLVTWGVIILTTILFELGDTFHSLSALIRLDTAQRLGGTPEAPGALALAFLPLKAGTALPWFLAGAIASALLAWNLGGDVRRTDSTSRWRDGLIFGGWLCGAYAMAQLTQSALTHTAFVNGLIGRDASFALVPILGLEGFACGAVIGLMVPYACRANIVSPATPTLGSALRDLLRHARAKLGDKTAAESWVFTPHEELGGITPAEAVQYKGYATGVPALLDHELAPSDDESDGNEADRAAPARPMPIVIEGGRNAANEAA